MDFTLNRIGDGPILTPEMDARMGRNLNGPSLIRAPDWLPNPLARYYLYFAHHNGSYLRLALADRIDGPWRMHEPGVLDLADSFFIDHIASPEIYIDETAQTLRLYFHGRTGSHPDGRQIQGTRVATSKDGLNFTTHEPLIGPAYFRIFQQGGMFYALARNAELLRSPDGFSAFESTGVPAGFPADIRHVALWRRDAERMTVFHTVIGDAPEVIYACDLDLRGDWRGWQAGVSREVLRPELAFEGADIQATPSKAGAIDVRVNQLRDPDVFVDLDGVVYLPYAIAGEAGIAMARLG